MIKPKKMETQAMEMMTLAVVLPRGSRSLLKRSLNPMRKRMMEKPMDATPNVYSTKQDDRYDPTLLAMLGDEPAVSWK